MSDADAGLVEQISERRAEIVSRIAELTDREVRIVCVTKGHPVEAVAAAIEAGFTELGESYAQELLAKIESLSSPPPHWHFIGRLQSNKVRTLAGSVWMWESIDRPSVARALARRDPGARVLVQVDLAGIEGRGGCAPRDVPAFVEECRRGELDVVGLMGIGPPGAAELSRPGFRLLGEMADDLGLVERSMGMSGDLTVAVEEGSTIVRIGTALMGARSTPARPDHR